MAARFVDDLAERVLGMPVIVDQPFISLRLLDGVEIAPLDILDQRDFQRLLVAEFTHDRRNLVQPRLLRRTPTPFAGHDLEAVAMRPDDDRLDDAARRDRFGQLSQPVLGEDPARLGGVRLDTGDRDAPHLAGHSAARDRCFT